LSATEHAALSRGASRLHLEVRADNARAIRFYQRAGYRQIGQKIGYYEDGATALLFSRQLDLPSTAVPPQRLHRAA
jgi:ribosomal-protein-alanine N-acetyltransferase